MWRALFWFQALNRHGEPAARAHDNAKNKSKTMGSTMSNPYVKATAPPKITYARVPEGVVAGSVTI